MTIIVSGCDELGIRLEIVSCLPIWEAQPLYRHQKHIERIVQGISTQTNGEGACIRVMDVYVQFLIVLKYLDIPMFC